MTTDGAKSGRGVTIRATKREDFDEIIPLLKQLWPANPIDQYVLAALRAKSLSPNPKATRAELIRRIYLDMLGLWWWRHRCFRLPAVAEGPK